MAGLSLSGLISGVDTDAIIQKILELENRRIELQESRKAALEEKRSAWQKVRTSLTTLRSKLDAIRFASIYRSRAVTLSDDSVATVTAGVGATLTTHRLEVRRLATAHVVASGLMNSPTAQLGLEGSLTLNGKTIDIVATDSLYSIRDKINALEDVGVTADVVQVANAGQTQYRLVLTSKQTGLDGAIQMSGPDALTQGLGFLDPTGQFANELVAAQNADFYLDGIHYDNYSSNVITDVLPNLTITLKRGGATSTNPDATVATDITVSMDVDKVANAIKEWVDALNEILNLLKDLTSYDTETKKAGALQGDALARSLQTALRGMLSNVVEGLPEGFRQLSDIGITTGRYGTADYGKVLLDTEKLKAKLQEDAEGVARVLGALRKNVALASNGGSVIASSVMASDSEHVYAAEDVINGETSSSRFGTAGGGWASSGIPSPDSPEWLEISFAQATVDQVQLYLADAANLKSYRLLYWDASGGNWQTLAEVEAHTGSFRSFDFDPVSTTRIRLEVTATTDGQPVQGITELQVLQQNRGPALEMYRYVNASLGAQGSLSTRDDALTRQIADIDKQISRMTEQMAAREEALRRQFERLEAALAELQSQGTLLLAQLSALTMGSGK
ncbi:MAG TPA: flagellar filament capping protein FliD [Symbiobacteriaceae bacterium]